MAARDRRAYLIGTVSRGARCANFNQPGVYTKVQSHLSWIRETIREGSCRTERSTRLGFDQGKRSSLLERAPKKAKRRPAVAVAGAGAAAAVDAKKANGQEVAKKGKGDRNDRKKVSKARPTTTTMKTTTVPASSEGEQPED